MMTVFSVLLAVSLVANAIALFFIGSLSRANDRENKFVLLSHDKLAEKLKALEVSLMNFGAEVASVNHNENLISKAQSSSWNLICNHSGRIDFLEKLLAGSVVVHKPLTTPKKSVRKVKSV